MFSKKSLGVGNVWQPGLLGLPRQLRCPRPGRRYLCQNRAGAAARRRTRAGSTAPGYVWTPGYWNWRGNKARVDQGNLGSRA